MGDCIRWFNVRQSTTEVQSQHEPLQIIVDRKPPDKMLDSFDLGGIDKVATVLLLVVLGFVGVSTVAPVQTPDWT